MTSKARHPNNPGAWDERPAGACPQCGGCLYDLHEHGEHVATLCHDCDHQETP